MTLKRRMQLLVEAAPGLSVAEARRAFPETHGPSVGAALYGLADEGLLKRSWASGVCHFYPR